MKLYSKVNFEDVCRPDFWNQFVQLDRLEMCNLDKIAKKINRLRIKTSDIKRRFYVTQNTKFSQNREINVNCRESIMW